MEAHRYSLPAMILHWGIAIGVIANWRLAETAEHAPEASAREIMGTHMSIGATLLILTLLRLAWRVTTPQPRLAAHLRPWERALSRIVHTLFYVLLIVMPLLGWVAMSSYGAGVDVLGLFELPRLPVARSEARGEAIFELHAVLGTGLLVLLVLHVLGTLKHTLIDRDGNLFRMLPFGRPKA